jgi:hypothetical protein
MIAQEYYSDEQLAHIEGDFLSSSGFNTIIDRDINIYKPDGSILAIFKKNVIPKELSKIAMANLKSVAKRKMDNRGKVTGKLDLTKVPIDITNIIKRDEFRVTQYKLLDGTMSKRSFGNMSQSNIIGFFEKPDRNYDRKINCRMTSFTAKKFTTKWNEVLPYIEHINNLYKQLAPLEYERQKQEANKTEFHIPNTSFSTITCNYNFRTALHKDTGDYKQGLSAFTVATEGEYNGFHLGFPKYRIAIDVREGDLLLFNPHEYHCNTEFEGNNFTRLSFVLYLRNDMASKCSNTTIAESLEKLNQSSLERYGKSYLEK